MVHTDTAKRDQLLADLNARMSALRAKYGTVSDRERELWTEYHGDSPVPRYPHTGDDLDRVLLRYPRVVAHLICESLGYFTPRSAANAVLHYQRRQGSWCEWYCHMAGSYNEDKLIAVGERTLRYAIRSRKHHTGYMSEYMQARLCILQQLAGNGPELASWF